MTATNRKRQPTISGVLTALQEAGAIRKTPNRYKLLISIDWKWLNAHAYTPAELAEFDYKSRLKGFDEDDKGYEFDDLLEREEADKYKIVVSGEAQNKAMKELRDAGLPAKDAVAEFLKIFPDAKKVQRPNTETNQPETVYPRSDSQ